MKINDMRTIGQLYKTIVERKCNKMNESHYKIGDTVRCKASGMTGKVVKMDEPQTGAYYSVETEKGVKKYSPDELEAMATEELDPVGKADADIDNDGDVDSSDKYLKNRRKKVSKAIKDDEKEDTIEEARGTSAKYAGQRNWLGDGKYGSADKAMDARIGGNKIVNKYIDKKLRMRNKEHSKQDPKSAKGGYSWNIVDDEKAQSKAKKKGLGRQDIDWKQTNSVKRGKLPESVELEEASMAQTTKQLEMGSIALSKLINHVGRGGIIERSLPNELKGDLKKVAGCLNEANGMIEDMMYEIGQMNESVELEEAATQAYSEKGAKSLIKTIDSNEDVLRSKKVKVSTKHGSYDVYEVEVKGGAKQSNSYGLETVMSGGVRKYVIQLSIRESVELEEAKKKDFGNQIPTGIKVFYKDKDGKEHWAELFTPRDVQRFEKELKSSGYKVVARALVYGKDEGPRMVAENLNEINSLMVKIVLGEDLDTDPKDAMKEPTPMEVGDKKKKIKPSLDAEDAADKTAKAGKATKKSKENK